MAREIKLKNLSKLKGKALREHMAKQIKQRGGFFGELLPLLPEEGEERPKIQKVIDLVLRQISKGHSEPALAVILRKQIQKAQAGDTKSAEFLFDRAYGKPTQTVVQQGNPIVTINHSTITIDEARQE